jgi:hypothetical protein
MKTASKQQYLEVTEAKYVSGYKLLLSFNDGEVRVVDFGPFLAKAGNPDTTDYRDLKKFKSFRIEYGDLIWGDHQMIFPIMDLYRGTILKGEEFSPVPYQLNEGVSRVAASRRTALAIPVSYKKPSKRIKHPKHERRDCAKKAKRI